MWIANSLFSVLYLLKWEIPQELACSWIAQDGSLAVQFAQEKELAPIAGEVETSERQVLSFIHLSFILEGIKIG